LIKLAFCSHENGTLVPKQAGDVTLLFTLIKFVRCVDVVSGVRLT